MVAQQKKRLLPVKRNKKIIIGKVAFEVDLKVSFSKKKKNLLVYSFLYLFSVR